MEITEMAKVVADYGIMIVISVIFLIQNYKMNNMIKNDKEHINKMLEEERNSNTAILKELAKSNENMAKSLELLQISNDRIEKSTDNIEFNLKEHRKLTADFVCEQRKK